MISLFGNITLILAMIFALLQSSLPLWGSYRHNPYLLAIARPAALGQFFCVAGAYILLTIAFATSDFSIAYVATNSHPSLPLMYRLTAIWGAHEGSILLWILLLNGWTVATIVLLKNTPSLPKALVLAILGMINFAFLCFLFFTSNPFLLNVSAITPQDLNPLLQDPGFVIHPPMLYAGYVGFSVAFAITQAALLRGRLDANWARITRKFALAAWCFLTFGITLGSWWAYRVLGWGGFWFWDPVENASLLPWIAGTALIHVLVLAEKKSIAQSWAALLSIITFALSLVGTFLVRSGVLISAHTFANDPARGLFLLILLAILLIAALIIYTIRVIPACAGIQMTQQNKSQSPRALMLLLNSGLLVVAMLTILLGTLYPLILDALHLNTISVGAPYFNTVMTPIVFLIMFFMGLAPFCHWQSISLKHVWQQSYKKLLVSFISAILLLWFLAPQLSVIPILTIGLSLWIILSLTNILRFLPAMSLAHLGFALLIIGIMLSSTLNIEREVRIQPGNAVTVGPYQFFFISAEGVRAANYRGIRADFEVLKNKRPITHLFPEKRIYTVRDMVMTKVAIHPGIFRDLYVALGEPLDENYWSVRIYYKPFMRFIWFGGIIMIIGGLLAILQRKEMTHDPEKN